MNQSDLFVTLTGDLASVDVDIVGAKFSGSKQKLPLRDARMQVISKWHGWSPIKHVAVIIPTAFGPALFDMFNAREAMVA